jgi:3-hydroxybutyryl-CoA dehydrogenase
MMNSELKIKKIGVIGAGTMGNGIAHVSALSGFDTILVDVKDNFVKRGFSIIQKNLERQMNKKKISQTDVDTSMARIEIATDIAKVSTCDLVVETAIESEEIKLEIFKELDGVCQSNVILASNTSSISISKIAAATKRPKQVIGMHFMNPVPIMKLVEIVRGKETNDSTINLVVELSKKMGKIPVECNDSPGFVSNRILMPMINEAIYCLHEGVGTPEAIDTIMKLGMAHPMGPLTLADLIGLDVCLNIINVLYADFRDKKYCPCPLLNQMVEDGNLGRKTGKGFYNYNSK